MAPIYLIEVLHDAYVERHRRRSWVRHLCHMAVTSAKFDRLFVKPISGENSSGRFM